MNRIFHGGRLSRAAWGLLGVGALAGSLTACRGPRNFENDNDQLRAENLELQRSVDALTAAVSAREGELDALRQQADGASPIPGAAPAAMAQLQLGRYSGPVDLNDDGHDDVMRLYLVPRDRHGRFYPVEGRAHVQIVRLTPPPPEVPPARSEVSPTRQDVSGGVEGATDPETVTPGHSGHAGETSGARAVVVAEATFEPDAFRAAYRTGFTGTHYRLELPLTADGTGAGAEDLAVHVTVIDAATGARHTTQGAYTVVPPATGP